MPDKLTCVTNTLVYMIQCGKCYSSQPSGNCQYIGQTGRTLWERFGEHRRDITNKLIDKSGVAEHFNRRDHTRSDITVIALEAIRQRRESLRRAREQQLITTDKTLMPHGTNRTTDR